MLYGREDVAKGKGIVAVLRQRLIRDNVAKPRWRLRVR